MASEQLVAHTLVWNARPPLESDGMNILGEKLHWWQTQGFVVAVALASMIPLLWPEIPPLVDLPGHMGRYRVQLAIGDNPWLSQWLNSSGR